MSVETKKPLVCDVIRWAYGNSPLMLESGGSNRMMCTLLRDSSVAPRKNREKRGCQKAASLM